MMTATLTTTDLARAEIRKKLDANGWLLRFHRLLSEVEFRSPRPKPMLVVYRPGQLDCAFDPHADCFRPGEIPTPMTYKEVEGLRGRGVEFATMSPMIWHSQMSKQREKRHVELFAELKALIRPANPGHAAA